jgi:hypothetical protein
VYILCIYYAYCTCYTCYTYGVSAYIGCLRAYIGLSSTIWRVNIIENPPSEKLRKKTRIKVLSVVENYIFEKYGVFTPLGASTKFPKMLTHGEVRMDCGYPRVSHPLYHIGYRGMRALGRIPPHTRRLRIVGLVVRR